MVMTRIETYGEAVAGEVDIAPREERADCGRIAVVEPGPDVDGVAADEDAHFGALRRRLPFIGIELRELRERRGGLPLGVVELAVDLQMPARGGCRDGWCWRPDRWA